MRVLIIAHGYPPKAAGGAELYAETHATRLAAGGDDVLVLAREANPTRPEFAVRREHRDGLDIVWVNNNFAAVRSFADTWTDDRIDAIAARAIDDFKPDVAHVHHLTCLSTSIVFELSARGIPVFCTLHDYWLLCHRGQLLDRDLQLCADPRTCTNCLGPESRLPQFVYTARSVIRGHVVQRPQTTPGIFPGVQPGQSPSEARRIHMRRVMDAVTHFFAPSEDLRQKFVAQGADPGRITVSEYGWTLPDRPPSWANPVRTTPGKIPGVVLLRIGFIGSLMVSKAPHLIVEACAELPAGAWEIHLFGGHADYHGDHTYRDKLAPLLARPGVVHHGPVDRSAIRGALDSIDILVVPSIWPENSPLVIREALLAGVPVVASRIGGIPETVADGANGLLFEPGSALDLASKLRQLIDDPHLLQRLASAPKQVRTVDDDVRSMRMTYERALAKPRSNRRIAAVVLNYLTPADTFLAARSLLLSRRRIDSVIVVDNADNGDCRAALEPIIDRVTYVRTGSNLGFSGGMNAGIERALAGGADAVLLVNSDVILPVDTLGVLERTLYATPGAGIAGPVVVGRTAPDTVASSGIDYNETTGRMRHRGVGTGVRAAGEGVSNAAAVTGCLMLVKREVFSAAGLFDPRFFFSFEDVDFCLRARNAGFSSVVARGAFVLHEGGRTMGARTPRRFYFGTRNQLMLANGRGGGISGMMRTLFVVALNVAHAARSSGGSLRGRLRAVHKGARDYFSGKSGPD